MPIEPTPVSAPPSSSPPPPYQTISLATGDEHGFVIRPTGDPLRGRTPPGADTVLRVRLQPWIVYRFVRLTIAGRFPVMSDADEQSARFRIDELRIGRTLVVDRVPAARFIAFQQLGNTWLWLPQWHDRHDEILLRVTNDGTEPASFCARLDVARDADPARRILATPVFQDPLTD